MTISEIKPLIAALRAKTQEKIISPNSLSAMIDNKSPNLLKATRPSCKQDSRINF